MKNKLRINRRDIFASLPLALIVQIASTAPPMLLGKFVDEHIKSPQAEWHLAYAILVAAVVIFAAEIWLSSLLASLSKKIIFGGYIESMGRLLRKERQLFERVKLGEMIDTFSRYIGSLEATVTALIAGLAPAIIGALAVATAIGYLVGPLVLVVIIAIHTGIFAVSYLLSLKYGRDLKAYTQTCYELSDIWVELLGANKVIQNEFAFDYAAKRLSSFVAKMTDALSVKGKSEGLARSFMAFGQTFSMLTVTMFLLMIHKDSLSFGNILAVLTLNGMLHVYSRAVSEVILSTRSFATYSADFKRIDSAAEYLHEGADVESGDLVINPLAVEKNGAFILKIDAPLRIRQREKIAIIGLSGAGKSTLISLLQHSHKQYQPFVSIGGVPAAALSSATYQSLVRICFQENDIISGSGHCSWFLRDEHAAAAAILREMDMPEDIIDGTRRLEAYGANISGGEAKRLNLTRLLLAPGAFNILDEPTTGLNPSLNKRVWNILFAKLAEHTIICATHDLDNLERFERVLLVEGGRIVADTSPMNLKEDEAYLRVKDRL